MAHLVASYHCEWKSSLENPKRLARFRQTINSPSDDPTLTYVQERGQPRPATLSEREHIPLVAV